MKTRSILFALSSVALLGALTACSSLMPPSADSPEATTAAATTTAPAVPTKTYTADDLTAMLTAAESTLGVSGKLLDSAQMKAAAGQVTGSMTALLDTPGLTLSPESCKTKFTAVLSKGLAVTPSPDALSALLSYGTNSITLATNNKPFGDETTGADARFDDLLSDCGSMQITVTTPAGELQTGDITLEKLSVTTTADLTIGLKETVQPPASAGVSAIVLELVMATTGDLAISAAAVNPTSDSSVVDAINAVVAEASKQ